LLSATNPESGLIQYQYDNNGNLTQKTDARSITTTYTYDNLNRVKTRSYSGESGYTTPTVNYHYDNLTNAKGKLIKVSSSVSTTEYTSFDTMGRVLSHKQTTDGTDYTTTYSYNLSGALIEQTYPSGRVVKNTLDVDSDLQQVQSKKANDTFRNYANSFNYTASGAVSSMQLGNFKWESTVFNSRLQPTQIALGSTQNATNLLDLDYTYGTTNNNGNVLTQTITVPTVGSNTGFTATQTYTYDSLNRIKDAEETISSTQTWKQTFIYDRFGNRNFDEANTTTLPKNCGISPNFTVCAADKKVLNPEILTTNNRLKTDQDNDSIDDYLFDNAGNTTKDAPGRTFIYDAENKQIEVKNSSNQTIGQYFYDGDGKRVKKYVPSTQETTIFVYDAGGKMVAEYSTQLAAIQQVSYLTNDHLGSPRINTNENGAVIARHDYQPFGEEIATSQRIAGLNYNSDEIRKKFTSYERDNETELDFAVNRNYTSQLGRFTQVDPYNIIFEKEKGKDESEKSKIFVKFIADPQIWNKFSYVVNNPLKFSDPDGRRPQTAQERKDLDHLRQLVANSTSEEFKTALTNAIKGIEDAIAASASIAKDPFGLKVALWAINRAAMPNSSAWGYNGSQMGMWNNGFVARVPAEGWKCNMFVAQALVQGGGMGLGGTGTDGLQVNSASSKTQIIAGIIGGVVGSAVATPVNLLTANQWADRNDNAIANFQTTNTSAMGNVIAWNNGGVHGHTAISIGADVVIYAGRDNVKVNTIMDVNRTFKNGDPTYRMKKP